MIFDVENWLWKSDFGTFWHFSITPIHKIQWFHFNRYCHNVKFLRWGWGWWRRRRGRRSWWRRDGFRWLHALNPLPLPARKWTSGGNSKKHLDKWRPYFFWSQLVSTRLRLVWLRNFGYHLTKKKVKTLMMTNSGL